MWNSYSIRYVKENKETCIFLALMTFVSSVLLSLITGVFYNVWIDWINRNNVTSQNLLENVSKATAAYICVLIIVCTSLITMIHHAFEVSMNSRMHHLGILASVGATPNQLRGFLIREVLILCFLPIIIGIFVGVGFSYGFMELIIWVTRNARRYEVTFQYSIWVGIVAFFATILTVIISAWIPAIKITKLTPLEAIHYGGELSITKIRKRRILAKVFGIEGELAGRTLYARRKVLRTSSISLMLAFVGLIMFLNVETISGLSTKETYYERYKDVWDIMLVTSLENETDFLDSIRNIPEVEECIAYEKLSYNTVIDEKNFQVPIYIMDDKSFNIYCLENDLSCTSGIVVVNRVWDRENSDRINKKYIPLFHEDKITFQVEIQSEMVTFNVDDFVYEMPNLREDQAPDSLTVVMSESMSKNLGVKKEYAGAKQLYKIQTTKDLYIEEVQEKIEELIDEDGYEIENRVDEGKSDALMRQALRIIVVAMAGLLACIGISNVFSSSLGQIYQRRREFARYLSVGISPEGLCKILIIEVLIVGLKPIIISIIINIPIVVLCLNAATISLNTFLPQAPIGEIVIFAIVVIGFVSLAYYLGGRKILGRNIIEVLKDDTMI